MLPQDGTRYFILVFFNRAVLAELPVTEFFSSPINFCIKCKYIGINLFGNTALVARAMKKHADGERRGVVWGANVSYELSKVCLRCLGSLGVSCLVKKKTIKTPLKS